MPRCARKRSESGIYHVMLRGINKQEVFKRDKDKKRFLTTLQYYNSLSIYDIYAYCLMDNHVHLLIQEYSEPVGVLIKRISSSYVYWFNRNYERIGHLFQERFKSEAVENDKYFLTVMRYIHQNPVKAGLTDTIKDYRWSSYHEYISKPRIINSDFALTMFSTDRNKAIIQLDKFMNETNEDICLDYKEPIRLPDETVLQYLSKRGIDNPSDLQLLKKVSRNEIVKALKSLDGVTVRQISRITGLSKSLVDRV